MTRTGPTEPKLCSGTRRTLLRFPRVLEKTGDPEASDDRKPGPVCYLKARCRRDRGRGSRSIDSARASSRTGRTPWRGSRVRVIDVARRRRVIDDEHELACGQEDIELLLDLRVHGGRCHDVVVKIPVEEDLLTDAVDDRKVLGNVSASSAAFWTKSRKSGLRAAVYARIAPTNAPLSAAAVDRPRASWNAYASIRSS